MSDQDWSQQASGMMASWAEAQRALWEAWAEMAWSAAKKTPTLQEASFNQVTNEWQKLASQSMQAWNKAVDPIARRTAEQFITAQGVMLRFIEFSARAWEKAAPKIQAGEDWHSTLTGTMEALRQSWLGLPEQAVAISQDMDQLWRLYMDQWRAFGAPWEGVWSMAPELMGRLATGDSGAWFEFSEAYRNAYQQTIGRMSASPNLGMARESMSRLSEGFDAFVAWNLANMEYQAVVGEIWDAAFKRFGEELTALADKDGKIESVRDLVMLWTRGAEGVFLEAFRSKRYTLAQGKLLNASMHYRTSQRRILEEYLENFDLPTRSEIDEAHRRIYELNKEVKALKKEVSELQAKTHPEQTKPSAPRSRTTPQKSTSTKKGG